MGKDTGVVAPNKQVATNGVASISGWATIQSMISSGGWNWATNSGTGILVTQNTLGSGNIGGWNYGEFQLFGTTAGNAYQFIAIGWNSTSSMFASTALGWSDPFNYATGSSASDPLGTTSFSQGGMNQFGVAPVPEPSTIALAGLGGLSLLLFRRRK